MNDTKILNWIAGHVKEFNLDTMVQVGYVDNNGIEQWHESELDEWGQTEDKQRPEIVLRKVVEMLAKQNP